MLPPLWAQGRRPYRLSVSGTHARSVQILMDPTPMASLRVVTDRELLFAVVALTLVAAFALDRLFGDPREKSAGERWYPPVLVGRAAGGIERAVARGDPVHEARWGTVGWWVLVGSAALLAIGLTVLEGEGLPGLAPGASLAWALAGVVALVVSIYWLKSAFAVRSLEEFCERPLGRPLDEMRERVAQVVNRPTSDLPAELLYSALVESAVENTTDSVVAPLLAYSLLGLPCAVAYRAINSLDALWGHREPRWRYFGSWTARADSAVNFLPDRLSSGLLRAVAGRRYVPPTLERVDPEATVAATIRTAAGLLGVRLERRGSYVVAPEARPPTADDVRKVLHWVRRASGLMLVVSLGMIAGLVDVGWTYFLR